MKRFILAQFAVAFTWLALSVAPVSAQFAYPFRPPQFQYGWQTPLSPYLNMLRGGDPAANYFIGVQPEFQRRQDRNVFYNSLQGLAMQLPAPPGVNAGDIDRPLASTGHPTAFGYTGSYFAAPAVARPIVNPFPQRGGPGQAPGQMGQGGRWPNYSTLGATGTQPRR